MGIYSVYRKLAALAAVAALLLPALPGRAAAGEPLAITISAPALNSGAAFIVRATVRNVSGGDLRAIRVTLALPGALRVVEGEAAYYIDALGGWFDRTFTWRVQPGHVAARTTAALRVSATVLGHPSAMASAPIVLYPPGSPPAVPFAVQQPEPGARVSGTFQAIAVATGNVTWRLGTRSFGPGKSVEIETWHVGDGEHVLYATYGATTLGVPIVVQNRREGEPVPLHILWPEPGSVFGGPFVARAQAAGASVALVWRLDGHAVAAGEQVAIDASTLASGPHTLSVEAQTAAGRVAWKSVGFIAQPAAGPLTVAIAEPAREVLAGLTALRAHVQGTLLPVTARWRLDGSDLGEGVTLAFDAGRWPPGPHTLAVHVTDGTGRTAGAEKTVRIAAGPEPQPFLTILSPAPRAQLGEVARLSAELHNAPGEWRVDWYLGEAWIGSGADLSWRPPAVGGEHRLQARATKNGGSFTAASTAVQLPAFPVTAPQTGVRIVTPAPGARLLGDFQAWAVLPDGWSGARVFWSVDGDPVGHGIGATIGGLVAGPHTLTATAVDPEGRSARHSIDIHWAPSPGGPPGVTIEHPAWGGDLQGRTFVRARVAGISPWHKVEWFLGWTRIGEGLTLDLDAADLPEGPQLLRAVLTDPGGISYSQAVPVQVLHSPPAPMVRIETPPRGVPLAGPQALYATVSRSLPGVRFTWYLDGAFLAEGNGVFWQVPEGAAGEHRLQVRAWDAGGLLASDEALLTFASPDRTPPDVRITYPAMEQRVSGLVRATAAVRDGVALQRVEWLVNETPVGQGAVLHWDTTAWRNGPHYLVARAYDTAGNVRYSINVVDIQNR